MPNISPGFSFAQGTFEEHIFGGVGEGCTLDLPAVMPHFIFSGHASFSRLPREWWQNGRESRGNETKIEFDHRLVLTVPVKAC